MQYTFYKTEPDETGIGKVRSDSVPECDDLFRQESRRKLVRQLENSLNPGGYLMIGHAELLPGDETNLQLVYPAVYKKSVKENDQAAKENIWKRKL